MAASGSQPVLRWFKRNFVQREQNFSPNSSTSSTSDSNSQSIQGVQTTPSTTIEGLLSVETESSLEENNSSPINRPSERHQYQAQNVMFQNVPSNRTPQLRRLGAEEDYDPDGRKIRERQFGTRNTLKRLNRYKLRPSLFSDYCNKPDDLHRGGRHGEGAYSSASKLHQQKVDPKRMRIGLFYTWSFSGQKPTEFVPLGEGVLGQNPKLDRLWEEAAKTLLVDSRTKSAAQDDNSKEYGSRGEATNSKRYGSGEENVREYCSRLYESPKSLDEYCRSPTSQQMWTEGVPTSTTATSGRHHVNFKETAPGEKIRTYSDRYPASGNFYRNVYPYTTLHRFNGYFPKSYCSGGPPAPPPPPYVCGQFASCTLPSSKQKATRSDVSNVENLHKTFYASMTGSSGGVGGAYYGNPPAASGGNPAVGPVLITPIRGGGQGRRHVFSPRVTSSPLGSGGRFCSGRNCLLAMVMSVTAAIILALAIALFIQINRDNNEFKNLHEQLAASSQFASDILPNSGFGSIVSPRYRH